MAFLRIKNINGQDYAYVVENSWLKGSRQKVKAYIGRLYNFEPKNYKGFAEFFGIINIEKYAVNNEKSKIVADLVGWEIFKHDIDRKEFVIDFKNMIVKRKNRNICIRINEGYLCSHTLANILNFRRLHEDESDDEAGFRLARAFIDAGIKIPEEVFIKFFEKIKGKEEFNKLKEYEK